MRKIVFPALGSGLLFLIASCGPVASAPSPSIAPTTSPRSAPSGELATPSPSAPAPQTSLLPTIPATSATPVATLPASSSVVASLSIATDRRLFDAFGQITQIKVIALDATGASLPLEKLALRFSSTRPTDFSVSETGLVKALKADGYSTVRVTEANSGQFAEITLSAFSSISSSGGSSGGGSSSSGGTAGTTPSTLITNPEFEGLEEDPT